MAYVLKSFFETMASHTRLERVISLAVHPFSEQVAPSISLGNSLIIKG